MSHMVVKCEVKVHEHENTRLSVETQERNHANPGCNREIVAKEYHEPHGADERERNCEQDNSRFHYGLGIEVKQKNNQKKRNGNYEFQPLFHSLNVFKL